MNFAKCLLVTALISPMWANAAQIVDEKEADFPTGLWDSVHYKVGSNGTNPVKIRVCVNADGTWQSLDSEDGMVGKWTKKGNNVLFSGNGKNWGGTGDVTVVNPYRLMAGTWQSWKVNGDPQHRAFTSQWKLAIAKQCE